MLIHELKIQCRLVYRRPLVTIGGGRRCRAQKISPHGNSNDKSKQNPGEQDKG
jgi:hypothetical protein